MQVVELVELIRRSGLGVEEHMAAGCGYPFQKMLRLAVEGQQPLSLEDKILKSAYDKMMSSHCRRLLDSPL